MQNLKEVKGRIMQNQIQLEQATSVYGCACFKKKIDSQYTMHTHTSNVFCSATTSCLGIRSGIQDNTAQVPSHAELDTYAEDITQQLNEMQQTVSLLRNVRKLPQCLNCIPILYLPTGCFLTSTITKETNSETGQWAGK